jgi:hypothetical protein
MLSPFQPHGGDGMKGIAILAAVAAMLTVAGCNRLGVNANATANATAGNAAVAKPADNMAANQAAPQTADAGKLNAGGGAIPASSSGAVQLDRTYMLGRWTDDGDCNKAIEFDQDGRFTALDGSTGLWNLDRDQLTVTGSATLMFRIVPIDQNAMTVVSNDGSLSRSTRC